MANLIEVLGKRVERGYLHNLETGRTQEFLFNPQKLTETYGGSWVRHEVPGLSYQPLVWMGGLNATFPLTLVFDQATFTERNGGPNVNGVRGAESFRRFLISLTQGNQGQLIKATAPSPVLFYWPEMISMRVRVLTVSITHEMFEAGTPRPRYYVAEVEMEEDAQDRVYADDIINDGTLRAARASRVRRL